MDDFLDARAALMALVDAFVDGSDTAREIAVLDAKIAAIEEQEAAEMRTAMEARRRMPIDAGEELDRRLREAMEACE